MATPPLKHKTRQGGTPMSKFIVELYLDGYETEKEMEDACEEFIYDQLNFTASCVKIERIKDPATDIRSADDE